MQVTVKVSKTDWMDPIFSLAIDGISHLWGASASEALTGASTPNGLGIFHATIGIIPFKRGDTTVIVDFGDNGWFPEDYDNPAAEIARRVNLVHDAFEAVRETYERSFTVTI